MYFLLHFENHFRFVPWSLIQLTMTNAHGSSTLHSVVNLADWHCHTKLWSQFWAATPPRTQRPQCRSITHRRRSHIASICGWAANSLRPFRSYSYSSALLYSQGKFLFITKFRNKNWFLFQLEFDLNEYDSSKLNFEGSASAMCL